MLLYLAGAALLGGVWYYSRDKQPTEAEKLAELRKTAETDADRYKKL